MSLLIDARRDYEQINAMPRLSAIPVDVKALAEGAQPAAPDPSRAVPR